MDTLSFATARTLTCEAGASTRLAPVLVGLGARRVLLVTDAGVERAGLTDPALAGLREAGLAVTVFRDVVADPPVPVVLAAAKAARDFRADAVLGIGGGSPLDTAKLAALLAASDQPLDAMYGVGNATGPRLPLVLVPTTAGTGSEVTPIAIVTTGDSEKKGIVSPVLLPDAAVLDPDLIAGLPRPVTAATGIDAMVHAIEAYTSRHRKNPISDALAREALVLLWRGLPRAWADGSDRAARRDTLLGATMAGMAFANAPVAAVHALAYPIGARFHVAHGVSNALMLPHVLRFNLPAAEREYAELAALLDPALADRPMAERAAALPAMLARLCHDLAVPGRLTEVGIAANDLPALAEDAMRQTRLLVNNPREVTLDDALSLYREALG